MKFNVDPKTFKDTLALVASATDPKHATMRYVRVESLGKNSLQLSGTNLSVTVQRTCEAEIKEEGTICIQADKLHNIVKNLDEEIKLTTDANSWVKIKSGTANYRVPAMESEKFPELASTTNYATNIEAEDLIRMIKSTAFSVTNEEDMYTLYGVKLEIANGLGRMVATDGARIAYVEREIDGNLDTLLPKNSLTYLTKLPKGKLNIGEDNNHIFFQQDDLTLATRKVTGSFPDYKMVINFVTDKVMKVSVDKFKVALKKIVPVAEEKVTAIKLALSNKELKMSISTFENGEGEITIPVTYKGDDVTINLNAGFLTEFMNHAVGEELHLNFTDGKNAVNLNFGKPDLKYIMMPLAIR